MDTVTPTFTTHYVSEKIIVSPLAFIEKRKWRAVAVVVDKRRPNKVKPIYKRKLFVERKPVIIRVKGVGLLVHPSIYEALQKRISQSMMEQERKLLASMFGIPDTPLKTQAATGAAIEKAIGGVAWPFPS